MLVLLLDVARATTSTTCWAVVEATVPADQAVVPTDAVFTAIAYAAEACDGETAVSLFDTNGGPVDGIRWVEEVSWDRTLYRFSPASPLAFGGSYTVLVEPPSDSGEPLSELTVTVGEPPPFPGVPPLGTVTIENHTCAARQVDLGVHVESELPLSGLLRTRYSVDGRVHLAVTPVDRQAVVDDTASLWSGFDVCASASLEDLSGREVWALPEVCAPALVCPSYDPPASVGHDLRPLCDRVSPDTRLTVHVDLPPADPGAHGILELYAGSAASPMRLKATEVKGGQTWNPDLHVTVPGLRPVCYDLRMLDHDEVQQWRVGPYCSHGYLSCPDERMVDPLLGISPPLGDPTTQERACAGGSGGRASGGSGAGWAVGIAFGLTVSRRRTPGGVTRC